MLTVQACPEIAPYVLEGLRGRLDEIGAGPDAPLCQKPASTECEEALRKLMVLYRPGIMKPTLSKDGMVAALKCIGIVASASNLLDLRFIDAMNATFEVWSDRYEPEARRVFLSCYRSALRRLVQP